MKQNLKDLALHLRVIHFTLLVTCSGLIATLTFDQRDVLTLAVDQLGLLTRLQREWQTRSDAIPEEEFAYVFDPLPIADVDYGDIWLNRWAQEELKKREREGHFSDPNLLQQLDRPLLVTQTDGAAQIMNMDFLLNAEAWVNRWFLVRADDEPRSTLRQAFTLGQLAGFWDALLATRYVHIIERPQEGVRLALSDRDALIPIVLSEDANDPLVQIRLTEQGGPRVRSGRVLRHRDGYGRMGFELRLPVESISWPRPVLADEDPAWHVPWILLYPGKCSGSLAVVSLVLLPVVTAVMIVLQQTRAASMITSWTGWALTAGIGLLACITFRDMRLFRRSIPTWKRVS